MSTITYKYKGKVLHKTDITTEEDFNKIAEDIINSDKPLAIRKDVGRQLLKEASKFNIPNSVKQSLEKTAGLGTGSVDSVYDLLRNRALLLYDSDKEMSSRIQKTADTLKDKYDYIVPREILEKTASFVDMVDRATGLHKHYSRGVERPEQGVYRYTVSDGDRLKKYAVSLKNDKIVQGADIKNHFNDIKGVLKDAFDIEVNNIKEAADTLTGLNSNQADLITKTAL